MSAPPLIAVHFPKAGGSSIGDELARIYGARLFRDYDEDPARAESPRNVDPIGYFARPVTLSAGASAVFGHFHPNKYRAISPAHRFVMLREPIDNLISIYFFWKRMPRNGRVLHEYFVNNNLSLLEFARLPLISHLMSRTYFGGVDMTCFDLIGRHDRRAESLSALGRLIGAEINGFVHSNRTTDVDSEERAAITADLKIRAALSDILADDLAFYERFAGRDV